MTPLQKLQDLFRELFQLDPADLDFGIYAPAFAERQIRIGGWLLSRTKLEDIHDRNDRRWEDLEREHPLLRQDDEGA